MPYKIENVRKMGNTLGQKYPEYVSEWSENNDITPFDLSYGSEYKAEWNCSKGHTYIMKVLHRTNKDRLSGCPKCKHQKSKIEEIIGNALKEYTDVEMKHNLNYWKTDIYLPNKNVAIEYDGSYWHSKRYDRDIRKTEDYKNAGIKQIRIREQSDKYKLLDIPGCVNVNYYFGNNYADRYNEVKIEELVKEIIQHID